jgi:hypothetical protein
LPECPDLGALVRVRDAAAGREHLLAVQLGRWCSLGRGGEQAPTWRVRPAPYDYDCHAMLSGEHLGVQLRDRHAWVVDRGRNGSWLNGERLGGRRPELLGDGDELALLRHRVVALRVRLAGEPGDGVHTVILQRADGLADRLSYVLSAGRLPAPALLPGDERPALWLLWRHPDGPGAAPVLWVDAGEAAVPLPEGRAAAPGGRYSVSWKRWPAPRDDRQLAGAFPA